MQNGFWMKIAASVISVLVVAALGAGLKTWAQADLLEEDLKDHKKHCAETKRDLTAHKESMNDSPLKIQAVEDKVEHLIEVQEIKNIENEKSHGRIEVHLTKIDEKMEKQNDLLVEISRKLQ